MITNKDIRVENGFLIINGDKFPLDGQSPEAIMEIVEDNSDTTPTENSTAPITSGGVYEAIDAVNTTIGDITQSGVTGADVASQLGALDIDISTKQNTLNVTDITSTVATDSTAVSEVYVLTYGKVLYIYFKLNAGTTDQTFVITNLPRIKNGTGCVIPAFFMNKEDYNKGCVCCITNATTSASVQFRCGDTPTGSGGTMYSAVCFLDN